MQPTLPTLPKLHHLRHNPQPTPESRHRYLLLSLKPLLHLPHPSLQHFPPPILLPQHTTLLTSPRPNPTAPRPQIKIRLTILLTQPLHPPFNPHLPLNLMPPKRQTRARIAPHIARFPRRRPIAVDDETAGVEFFEVDVAGGDGARGEMAGGETDCFGLVDEGGGGVGEPGVELGEGGWGELDAGEGVFGVLVCLLRGGGTGGGD